MTAANAFPGTTVKVALGGSVLVNSAYGLFGLTAGVSFLGSIPVVMFAARAAVQDFETNIHPFFFTSAVRKQHYLGGRLLESWVISTVALAGIGVGLFAGTLMPGIDRAMLGAFHWQRYVWPYVILVVPNVVILATIFFSIAVWTRSMMGVYAAVVLLLSGYVAAGMMRAELDNHLVTSLIDPLGLSAFGHVTQYWT